jgi:hypothetical protein
LTWGGIVERMKRKLTGSGSRPGVREAVEPEWASLALTLVILVLTVGPVDSPPEHRLGLKQQVEGRILFSWTAPRSTRHLRGAPKG